MSSAQAPSPFKQPKAVWAVAFACVISFMGIGLVDPILPALTEQLHTTPGQTSLLFTSYLVVTAIMMLFSGWVASVIGSKRTLILGLAIIVVFAALAGASGSIDEIIGFRAGWGVGNAFFIATSLAVIVGSASGGFAGAIVLYETALGVGIACGPLVGGLLGNVSWRGPFFGVAALMAIALIATVVLVPATPRPATRTSPLDALKALRHRSLLTTSVVGIFYNWAFFTVLGYAPYFMGISNPINLGWVFFGWGILVALFAVFGAPFFKRTFGTPVSLYLSFAFLAILVAVIGVWHDHHAVVIVATILTGIVIGLNNTLVTTAVMSIAPVPRPVASATYGFVRFIGGGIAPWAAGKMAGESFEHATVPFVVGALALVVGALVLSTVHGLLRAADAADAVPHGSADEAEAEAIGDAS